MNSAARFTLAVLLAICAQILVGAPARAETTVASLGVRSLDGELDLERRLSAALRSAAAIVAEWSVSKREASLEQMTLAHGCEEPDAQCLGEISRTLGVDLLVYGTVVGTPVGHALTLYQYDTTGKEVRSADARSLKAAQLRGPGGKEALESLLSQLNGGAEAPAAPATGQLRIHGDMPGAQIAVDGEPAGSLDEQGSLTLELSPGRHTVRAAGAAFAPAEEKTVFLDAGGTREVELKIAQPDPVPTAPALVLPDVQDEPAPAKPRRSLRRAFGWVSLGIGAAFAVATIYSWVRIEGINDDSDFLAYRGAFPRANEPGGVRNVCPAAERGELAARDPDQAGLERRAKQLCDEADTLQTLQYVFIAGTVVGAGVGTYLLVSARRKERTVSFAPRFGTHSASLEARLSF